MSADHSRFPLSLPGVGWSMLAGLLGVLVGQEGGVGGRKHQLARFQLTGRWRRRSSGLRHVNSRLGPHPPARGLFDALKECGKHIIGHRIVDL